MRTTPFILAALMASSAGLTALWLHARSEGRQLQTAINKFQTTIENTTPLATEEQSRQAALAAEIVDRENALGYSPAALETKRRAASLAVIDQLKQTHTAKPPPPREKAPPTALNGFRFPELFSDPEYSRLSTQLSLSWLRLTEGRKFRQLGLSPEICEKAFVILYEKEMSFADYHQISGQGGIPGSFYEQQIERTNQQMKELLGEEVFKRWTSLNPNASSGSNSTHEALLYNAKHSYVALLTTRLSYTDTPLTSEQTDQLAELMAVQTAGSETRLYQMLYDNTFIQNASQFLSPPQAESLRQLKAERDASVKRSKLPKSSELPRNTLPAK